MNKHGPATPLPWRIAQSHEAVELLGQDGDCVNSAAKDSYGDDYKRVVKDMHYERHAANAYPKLVDALRELHAIDERKLKATEKRPYAIGVSVIRERVERNRKLLRVLGGQA